MIPKVIHYCWFGRNPLPPLAIKCIESWKKYLPDYEIKEWNEDNFDVNIIPYTAEAYKAKKYAFVSDYARFWILYKYGGLYFDTDVEVIRPMDDIIERGAFMGCESDGISKRCPLTVAPGLGIGCEAHHEFYNKMLNDYKNRHFLAPDLKADFSETVVQITTLALRNNGLKEIRGIQNVGGIVIYPSEYFCPINIVTKKLHITKNTKTIHHYTATWVDRSFLYNIKRNIYSLLPEWLIMLYNKR